jgi:small basic protein
MIFLVFALILGIVVGAFIPGSIPLVWGKYFSVALLAGLDSILGAGKAVLQGRFDLRLFISGFLTNTILAGLLTYAGDRLGVELYLAAVITFGVRIFQDLSILRVHLFKRFSTVRPQGDLIERENVNFR